MIKEKGFVMKKYWISSLLMLLLFVPLQAAFAEDLKDWGTAIEVDAMKEWTITFKQPVNEKYLQYIYVVDENGNKKDTKITVDTANNQVKVAPVTPYEEGHLYTLKVEQKLRSASGASLKEGIVKTFFIEPTKESEIVYSTEVQVAEGLQYITEKAVNNSVTYEFRYTGNSSYKQGDIILIEDVAAFPNGFAGEIVELKQENSQIVLIVKEAEMDAVFDAITLNEDVYLTAQQLAGIEVPGYDVEVRNIMDTSMNIPVGEIKLSPTLKNRGSGYNAEVKYEYILKNLKLNVDFERKKLTQVKYLRITISGTQEVRKNVRFGKFFSEDAITQNAPITNRVIGKKQELLEFEYTLPRVNITVSIPGVGGYFETGIIFEAAAAGGARFTAAETTEFEFGVVYKNGDVYGVTDNDTKNNETSVVGFGEIETKFGVVGKAGINVLTYDIVEGSIKGGPYAEFGVYASLTDAGNACFNVEAGLFSSIGMTLLPDAKWEIGIELEEKKAFAKPIDCEEVIGIEAKFTESSLVAGDKRKLKVNKVLTNLKDGTKGTENSKFKNVSFEYDKQFIEIDTKDGYVKIKEGATAQTVPVKVIYKDKDDTFTTSFNVNIAKPTKHAAISYQMKTYNNRFNYVELTSKSVDVSALNKLLKQAAVDADETYNWFLSFREPGDFFVKAETKITYNQDGYLSVSIYEEDDYLMPRVNSFLIDMETGKRLTISDVFKTKQQREELFQKVKSELRRLREASSNPVYREDRLAFDENWGIAANGDGYIVIINHGYSISAANIVEIYELQIPFSYGEPLK